MLFEIQDRDQRAFARHRNRDRAADAAVAAGNDGDLVFQLTTPGNFGMYSGRGDICRSRPGWRFCVLRWLCVFFGCFRLVMDVHVRSPVPDGGTFQAGDGSGSFGTT